MESIPHPVLFAAAFAVLIAVGLFWARRMAWFGWLRPSPSILEVLPEAIVGVDPPGTVRSLNDAAERLFGYQEEEVRGMPLSVLIPGATAFPAPGDTASTDPLSQSGIRTDAIRKGGGTASVVCFPLDPGATGNRRFVLLRDESNRPPDEEAPHRREMLQAVLQQSSAPMVVVDHNIRVQMFNSSCEQVLGPGLIKGSFLHQLFPDTPVWSKVFGEMEKGKPARLLHQGSGYLFTSSRDGHAGIPEQVLLVGEAPPGASRASAPGDAIRRLEDLLTEINGYSEMLLADARSDDPAHEDLARVNGASRKAITVLQALSGQGSKRTGTGNR